MRSKIINKEKDTKNEREHKEPLVAGILDVKEPSYFKIFKCGKKKLNRIDVTCKRV